MKQCRRCKIEKEEQDFLECNRNLDGKTSYCRKCLTESSQVSAMRRNVKPWHENGFLSEIDEFNWALRHYAKVFNMPQLLKYQTKTGPIKRYYKDE